MKLNIEEHTSTYKSFMVYTEHLSLKVDYDDVNQPDVDAAIQQLRAIIEKHWNPETHTELFRKEVMKIWIANKYDLQSDYDDEGGLEGYLANHGIK